MYASAYTFGPKQSEYSHYNKATRSLPPLDCRIATDLAVRQQPLCSY
jgi:hypothetical protein